MTGFLFLVKRAVIMGQPRNQRHFNGLLLITIGVISVLAVLIYALYSANSGNSVSNSKGQVAMLPTATLKATASATKIMPTNTVAIAATPTPPPSSTPTGITIVTPEVAIGEKIPLPLLSFGTDIVVRRTDATPLATLQEVRQALNDRGLDFAVTGKFEDKPVTLIAVYGLVTMGGPTADGKAWLGMQNVSLPNGMILPHIENRLMWVLDFGNTNFPAAGPACMSDPCPTPQIFNHSVYTFDAETKTLISGDFYTK